MESLQELLKCSGDKYLYQPFYITGDSLIDRARITLLAAFQNSEQVKDIEIIGPYDWFLEFDSDISFRAHNIEAMLEKADANNIHVIGGPYTYKSKDRNDAVARGMEAAMPQIDGLTPVKYAGTGCLAISGKAIEDVCNVHPELMMHTNPDIFGGPILKTWAVFQPLPVDMGREDEEGNQMREYLSEDYALCHRLAAVGYQAYLDPRVKTIHWEENVGYQLPRS